MTYSEIYRRKSLSCLVYRSATGLVWECEFHGMGELNVRGIVTGDDGDEIVVMTETVERARAAIDRAVEDGA